MGILYKNRYQKFQDSGVMGKIDEYVYKNGLRNTVNSNKDWRKTQAELLGANMPVSESTFVDNTGRKISDDKYDIATGNKQRERQVYDDRGTIQDQDRIDKETNPIRKKWSEIYNHPQYSDNLLTQLVFGLPVEAVNTGAMLYDSQKDWSEGNFQKANAGLGGALLSAALLGIGPKVKPKGKSILKYGYGNDNNNIRKAIPIYSNSNPNEINPKMIDAVNNSVDALVEALRTPEGRKRLQKLDPKGVIDINKLRNLDIKIGKSSIGSHYNNAENTLTIDPVQLKSLNMNNIGDIGTITQHELRHALQNTIKNYNAASGGDADILGNFPIEQSVIDDLFKVQDFSDNFGQILGDANSTGSYLDKMLLDHYFGIYDNLRLGAYRKMPAKGKEDLALLSSWAEQYARKNGLPPELAKISPEVQELFDKKLFNGDAGNALSDLLYFVENKETYPIAMEVKNLLQNRGDITGPLDKVTPEMVARLLKEDVSARPLNFSDKSDISASAEKIAKLLNKYLTLTGVGAGVAGANASGKENNN